MVLAVQVVGRVESVVGYYEVHEYENSYIQTAKVLIIKLDKLGLHQAVKFDFKEEFTGNRSEYHMKLYQHVDQFCT